MILATFMYGLFLISSTVVCQWTWKYFALRKKLNFIPGPKSPLFIGEAFRFLRTPHEDRLEVEKKLLQPFKNDLVLIWIGTDPFLIIRTPKYAKAFLTSNIIIKKSLLYDKVKSWLGNGLVTSSGNLWATHRRLITPAFHFNILEEYSAVMQDKVDILIECLDAQLQWNKQSPINIFELVKRFSLDTVCEATMGINIDCQREPDNEYLKAVHTFTTLVMQRLFELWLQWDAVYFLTKKGKQYLNAIKTMHKFTETVIAQKLLEINNKVSRSKNVAESVDESGKRKRRAFLDLLLDANESSENKLTMQEIREEVDTIMFAGYDTVASAISWGLFALGNEPEIQDKVRHELKEVFGNKTGTSFTKQLNELKYLDRVIKEILRLYPSAPFVGRQVESDTIIDGNLIPKGTTVHIHFYQLHRNPDVWEDPEKFDPDRFLLENIRSISPYAYAPFSAGPRNCIGQKFASLELKIALVEILRKWRITSVLNPSEIKMTADMVLNPYKEKLELYFEPSI